MQLSIWELAWPSVLSNLLFSLTGLVATKVVAELGAPAAAAASVGNQVFFSMQAILMAVSVGTTALVARAWGAEDREEAERATTTSLFLGAAFALLMTSVGMGFAYRIAGLFGLEPETTALAGDFIYWLSLFNVAFAVNFIMSAALRAAGDARTPLWIGIATNLISVVLLYALVFGNFGAPALGVKGAAIANGIAFSVAGLVTLLFWFSGRLLLPFGGIFFGEILEAERVRRLLQVGYPAALEQGVFRIGFFVFLWVIGNFYGTDAFAAYGIGVNILSLCFVVGLGFSIAGATLVGQHLGAGEQEEAAASGWRSLRWAMGSMIVIGIAIIAAAEPIAAFMIDDERVIYYTVVFIYILGACQPLMAVEFAIGGALRGAGDTRYPLKATMAGLILMRCTLAVVFAVLELPVEWVFGALIGDYAMKAIMLTRRFRSGRWKTMLGGDEAATA